jgi:hypothetical protein
MSAELKSLGSPDRQRRHHLGPRAACARKGDANQREAARPSLSSIRHSSAMPPVEIPPGHIGPVVIPGTGRVVYWTGRVAIGLRHQASLHGEAVPHSTLWVQDLMLGPGHAAA